ncbi:hypothetical protein ACIHJG_38985 [Streptomyces sp. NPDC052415]|uniref:hypothetical protein n=1 Tax=Streptomyces sp. NPDC052415 TaxID=3365690 RepID=UPI0037D89833
MTALTPRDVPDAREDLITWAAHAGKAGTIAPPAARGIATGARAAGQYYVASHMTALARTVGDGLLQFDLMADDLPEPQGLLVWDGKATAEHDGCAPVAVLWRLVADQVHLLSLADAADYRAWAMGHEQAAAVGRSAAAEQVRKAIAGRLAVRGQTVFPADGREVPWDRLELATHVSLVRTLLATWFMTRQPADARRGLHEVEEVGPSRSAQKRIARSGGDPTATVRYVTLRRALRPPSEGRDEDGHATRIYRHRWFVRPHKRTYPDKDHPEGKSRKRVGPYLVTPRGCEDAPILDPDKLVNVLRR